MGIPGYADREAVPSYLAADAGDIEVLAERSQVNLESLAAARPDLLLFTDKLVEDSGARDELAGCGKSRWVLAFGCGVGRLWACVGSRNSSWRCSRR